VFQYNPLIHFLEVNDERELVCTVSRLDLLSPRMRYNVHDQGGLVEYARVRGVLARHGFDLDRLGELPEVAGPRGPLPWADPIPLPFVWVNGRRDATISVMGANIYPEDVEAVLYGDSEVAARLHSFLLSVVDDEAGTPRPEISLELTDLHGVDDEWRATRAESFAVALAQLNMDFRSSIGEFPSAMRPIVRTFGRGEGPFLADAHRIKQRRILAGSSGAPRSAGTAADRMS
jgi:phenylacetate-CoA ligase